MEAGWRIDKERRGLINPAKEREEILLRIDTLLADLGSPLATVDTAVRADEIEATECMLLCDVGRACRLPLVADRFGVDIGKFDRLLLRLLLSMDVGTAKIVSEAGRTLVIETSDELL